jgi:hypothetical protein
LGNRGDHGRQSPKTNLHRATLRACLRLIHTAETLDQARTQLARLLKVFDKLQAQGLWGRRARFAQVE